jgi:hypothetical protein
VPGALSAVLARIPVHERGQGGAMTKNSGVKQAAEVLRVYLTTMPSVQRDAELSALANLIYQDRLNTPPLDPGDPQAAIEQTCQRFSDIIADHLLLGTLLLSITANATGRTPDQILDDIIRFHLGGYE